MAKRLFMTSFLIGTVFLTIPVSFANARCSKNPIAEQLKMFGFEGIVKFEKMRSSSVYQGPVQELPWREVEMHAYDLNRKYGLRAITKTVLARYQKLPWAHLTIVEDLKSCKISVALQYPSAFTLADIVSVSRDSFQLKVYMKVGQPEVWKYTRVGSW